jgi:hypothetical protein
LGHDEKGRERQASRAFTGTRREAQSELATFVSETERDDQEERSLERRS